MRSLFFKVYLPCFFLLACTSNSINKYPLYSDQVAKVIVSQSDNPIAFSYNKDVPDFTKQSNYIAPGNLFSIYHSSDSKLSGKFRVDFNGVLHLPYNVNVDVTNRTFEEVKEIVLTEYRKFFQKGVESVRFELSIKSYWVEVRGLVKKPGRYLVRPTDTLDIVVDLAGGVLGDISTNYYSALIKSSNFDYKVLLNRYYESSENVDKIKWFGGDNIFITKLDSLSGVSNEIPFVTLIGGVNKPGKILHQRDASLFYYIEKSGGLIQGLGYDECYVFRNTSEGLKRIKFNFDKPESMPLLFPNDTVYLNSKVQTEGDIWLLRLGQIGGILSTAALLIIAL